MIQHASDLSHKARLHNEDSTKYQTGSKDLLPLSLGSHVLYNKNPDNNSKRPEWSKGTIKDIDEPGHKYTITKDNCISVTRIRHDIRPDGSYVTQSGRISKPPDHLIAKM